MWQDKLIDYSHTYPALASTVQLTAGFLSYRITAYPILCYRHPVTQQPAKKTYPTGHPVSLWSMQRLAGRESKWAYPTTWQANTQVHW